MEYILKVKAIAGKRMSVICDTCNKIILPSIYTALKNPEEPTPVEVVCTFWKEEGVDDEDDIIYFEKIVCKECGDIYYSNTKTINDKNITRVIEKRLYLKK